MTKIIIILLITIISLLAGCDMFSTRTPEEPDKGKSSFIPPTSAQIVVSNFISAIEEKNADNYILCLADTSQSDKFSFYFKPTADAFSIYSSIYANWNLFSERNYFNKLISIVPPEKKPQLVLTNSRFEVLLPDSAVFVADYELDVDHELNTVDKKFKGTLQFSIFPRTNGWWSIKSWYDLKSNGDSIQSWSFLKAQLVN